SQPVLFHVPNLKSLKLKAGDDAIAGSAKRYKISELSWDRLGVPDHYDMIQKAVARLRQEEPVVTARSGLDKKKEEFSAKGIRYGVSIGRRAPMHRMHVDCLREIQEAGLKPIFFIGSTNDAKSPLYDPIRNPLTLEQQRVQLRLAVPDLYEDRRVLTLP